MTDELEKAFEKLTQTSIEELKSEWVAKKKGNKSWKPSALLNTHDKPEGYQLRWVNTQDPANLARRKADGWVPLSSVTNTKTGHERPGHIEDGKPLTTVTEYRGSVLMALPDEDYQEHREFFNQMTRRQTAGLREKAEAENRAKAQHGTAAQIYGETSIERTIIK